MAIYQQLPLSFTANGDGVTTVQYLDFGKVLEEPISFGGSTFRPVNGIVVLTQPTATVLLPNQQYTTITGTATVEGTILTITWASAPPAQTPGTSGNSAGIVLGF